MTTTQELIAALEAGLAAIKAQLETQQPPALSPLDAMLDYYWQDWTHYDGFAQCDGNTIACTMQHCDRSGHAPAMVRAIAAIPAMIAALRAVNEEFGSGQVSLNDSADTALYLVRQAIIAAGDTP